MVAVILMSVPIGKGRADESSFRPRCCGRLLSKWTAMRSYIFAPRMREETKLVKVMSDPPADAPQGLWAITSYFNAMGYRTRRTNYRTFWRHLTGVPLLTMELGHEGRYELGPEDATVLVQTPSRDVLWQKERLLNRALEALPGDCHTVVWLDSDILFERTDWPWRAMDALE